MPSIRRYSHEVSRLRLEPTLVDGSWPAWPFSGMRYVHRMGVKLFSSPSKISQWPILIFSAYEFDCFVTAGDCRSRESMPERCRCSALLPGLCVSMFTILPVGRLGVTVLHGSEPFPWFGFAPPPLSTVRRRLGGSGVRLAVAPCSLFSAGSSGGAVSRWLDLVPWSLGPVLSFGCALPTRPSPPQPGRSGAGGTGCAG